MAIVNIPNSGVTIQDPAEIREFLSGIGIDYERWPIVPLPPDSSEEETLRAYSESIERLKTESDYTTADVIEVTPNIPGLEGMLDKFRREHWHDEDEVRFIIDGRGLFHISPPNGDVVSIEMEPGDLIRVPSRTLHWFNVCRDRRIRAIRLFTDRAGWTPLYTNSGIDNKYQPMCFNDSPFRALV
jgi:1,2-dihydroxy-3-keto-5-methylthiopentene dioxygenase